jgi:hypothetical protein
MFAFGYTSTPTEGLSPLQAQLELALPPNRGLPDRVVEIDLDALAAAGSELPSIDRIENVVRGSEGRVYSMPGGGYEMQFPYPVPPEFTKIKVLR